MIHTRYKKDLAGQLGNLLNRTTAKALIHNGILPVKHDSVVDPSDESVHQIIAELAGKRLYKIPEIEYLNTKKKKNDK